MNSSTPLVFICPSCAGTNTHYTCRPECCFQHACEECRTTFIPETIATGGTAGEFSPPSGKLEEDAPTVPCACCGSTAVYMLENGDVACHACHALLDVRFRYVAEEEYEEE